MPVELFGEKWVAFRDENGVAACVYDQCAHRACPLSLGTVTDGQISCAYHGWQFNGNGECTKMPSTQFCKGIAVAHMPTVEVDGWVWVWAGDSPPAEVPRTTLPPSNFVLHAEIEVCQPTVQSLCSCPPVVKSFVMLRTPPVTVSGFKYCLTKTVMKLMSELLCLMHTPRMLCLPLECLASKCL